MKFTASDIKQDRQWRAMAGLSKEQFYTLLEPFVKCYLESYGEALQDRKVDVNIGYCIGNEEELLLFTLFSLKAGLTFDVLGVVSGMSGSNAKRNQGIGLDILAKVLAGCGVMPERKLLSAKDFEEFFKKEKSLVLDATEQRVVRPGDGARQSETYSGKKKPTP